MADAIDLDNKHRFKNPTKSTKEDLWMSPLTQ